MFNVHSYRQKLDGSTFQFSQFSGIISSVLMPLNVTYFSQYRTQTFARLFHILFFLKDGQKLAK